MDDGPIKEKKTIFEQAKDIYKRIIMKPPKHENYFVSPYELENNMIIAGNSFTEFGFSSEEALKAFIKFNKVL